MLDRDDLELYDVEIAIDFYARLRGQVKYAGQGSVDQADACRCRGSAAPPARCLTRPLAATGS